MEGSYVEGTSRGAEETVTGMGGTVFTFDSAGKEGGFLLLCLFYQF